MTDSLPDQTKPEQENTPNDSKGEEFQPKSEKEKQIRDSIMNDLYNDLSSSDEEEESPSPADLKPEGEIKEEEKSEEEKVDQVNIAKKDAPQKKSPKNKGNKGYTKEQMLKDAQDMEKKKIAQEANEALKDLYGDDYVEPGNPFDQQSIIPKNNLTSKMANRLGQLFTVAKDKYNTEMSNPESKLSTASREIGKITTTLKVAAVNVDT